MLCELVRHRALGQLHVDLAVFPEKDDAFGVYEIISEVFRQYKAVEILSPAGGKIVADAAEEHRLLYIFKFARYVEIEPEPADDVVVSVADPLIGGLDCADSHARPCEAVGLV